MILVRKPVKDMYCANATARIALIELDNCENGGKRAIWGMPVFGFGESVDKHSKMNGHFLYIFIMYVGMANKYRARWSRYSPDR